MKRKTPAQLERDIAKLLAGRRTSRAGKARKGRSSKGAKPGRRYHLEKGATVDGKTPLYGHTSEATAYEVADYPYGFRERTKIRYWLEKKAKQGWRFVSQTLNPKTQRWNKPKASTYVDWGAAMFLDDKGHVKWEGVGQYSNDEKIADFIKTFPGADMSLLRQVVPAKLKMLRGLISGERFFTINGVRQEPSESDTEQRRKQLAEWEEMNIHLDQATHC